MSETVEMPIIIEFNGLPATGKTTIASELMILLKSKGIKCQTNYIKKWQENSWSLMFDLDCVIVLFLSFIFSIRLWPLRNRVKYSTALSQHLRKYRDYINSSEKGCLVIDQGFVQSFVSIAYGDIIEKDSLLFPIVKYLQKRHIKFVRIDCVNDVDLSCQRLGCRERNSSRLHDVKVNEQKQVLNVQKKNFETIRRAFDSLYDNQSISINTLCAPDKNAKSIYTKLIEFGLVKK